MTTGSSIAPLSQIAISRPMAISGKSVVRITIMAAGRCNHAGVGHLPWTGTNGGNKHTIGIENQNDGRQAWPKQQIEATNIATAALLKKLGRNTNFMTEHKSYAPGRKVDRHTLTLSSQRALVKELLRKGEVNMSTDPSSWAKADWDWAKSWGIMTSDSKPHDGVTKQELAVHLRRYHRRVQRIIDEVGQNSSGSGASVEAVISEIKNRL